MTFNYFPILISAYINGWKYHSVRILTEVATWSFLCLNIFLLIGADRPTPLKTAVMIDVFANGVFGGIVQLCDNYMFFNRYLCISMKTPRWKHVLVHSFIWLVLMATWFPQYTFLPLVMNTNSPGFISMQYNFTQLQSWSLLAYNMYFSYEFAVILYQWYNGKLLGASNIDGRVIVAVKSIIHCFVTGITGVLWIWYYFPASESWEVCILFCMHFLFNAKIERTILGIKPKGVGSRSRSQSEVQQSHKSTLDGVSLHSTLKTVGVTIKNFVAGNKPGILGRNSVAQSTADLVEQLEQLDAEAEVFLSAPFFTRVARVVADDADHCGEDHAMAPTADGAVQDFESGSQSTKPARPHVVPEGDLKVEEVV